MKGNDVGVPFINPCDCNSSAPTALRKPFGVDGGIGGPRPPIPPSTPNLGEPPQVASRPESLRAIYKPGRVLCTHFD